MGKNNIQFQSDTKKYEEDCYVKGNFGFNSNLYIFPFTKGTNRDLRKEYADFLLAKYTGETIVPEKKHKIDTFWGVFCKPENMEYAEFCEKVNSGEIGMIGNTPIIPTGNDLTKLDMNGNLLVKTINSNLDNYQDCGNMLINGETGAVIHSPKPSRIINALDYKTGNYYLVEIYKTTLDKETGNQYVSGKEYNFLTPEGKLVNSDTNITLSYDEDFNLVKIPRNYFEKDGKKLINDWNIYPCCYALTKNRDIYFFDSPLNLLEDYRTNGYSADILDSNAEINILADVYERKAELENVRNKADNMYFDKKISSAMYDKLAILVCDEYDRYDEFRVKYETARDRELAEQFKLVAPEQII